MIVTRKKPVEQVLAMLRGVRRVALVGCASCAAACQTGGEKELEQMRQLLQEQGIETVGTVLPDECCHMLLVKRGPALAIWLGMSWPMSAGNCCAAATNCAKSTPVS